MHWRPDLRSGTPGGGSEAAGADAADLQETIERLAPSLRVAVIFGGDKLKPGSVVYQSQNSRAWKSYEAVAADIAAALLRLGFHHVCLIPDDMNLADRVRREQIHMAWINSAGVQGQNPAAHAPAMLEMFGLPYVGHDPLSVTTLDNKHAFKREAACAGLPTAPFTTWHMARGAFRPEINTRFERAFGSYDGPFVVKPVSGRASLNVCVVDNRAALPEAVAEVHHATGNTVLIEKYLRGRETCIAVAGPIVARGRRLVRGGAPFTFAALERVLAPDERIFTSMDLRPITGDRFEALDPARDAQLLARLHQLARDTYLEFNLGSLVRLDLRADESGEIHILEANPKPDLKNASGGVTSLIAAGLPACGMDYDDLILSLFADRLDYLFRHRPGTMRHIVDLLDSSGRGRPERSARTETASGHAPGDSLAVLNDTVADINVGALNAAAAAGRRPVRPATVPDPAARDLAISGKPRVA